MRGSSATLPAVTLAAFVAFAAIGLVSCSDRVVLDGGRDALLQVSGATFRRTAMPATGGGPAVRNANLATNVRAGSVGQCTGVLEPQATAVALALAGDEGYWVLPAGVPDVTTPGFPTFAADISFGAKLAPGRRDLVVRAVDERGAFGPELVRPLVVLDPRRPIGKLVIALAWDTQADLDLHVVDPNGVEIWKRNVTSYVPPPPGSPPEPPGTKPDGGLLDLDSNASCVIDGRRAENVVWENEPPRGRYVVRVDTFSLCAEPGARWGVEVRRRGERLAEARGTSSPAATRFDHGRGAGVLALEFDLP